jgi:hypothetical protein
MAALRSARKPPGRESFQMAHAEKTKESELMRNAPWYPRIEAL